MLRNGLQGKFRNFVLTQFWMKESRGKGKDILRIGINKYFE